MGSILPRSILETYSRVWRRTGEKVVFTNGCFDIFHAGHARFLYEARACGSILVVGLNSDESISGIKPGRPIIPFPDRVEVLMHHKSVDYIVAFDEPTPAKLIDIIRPSVLVKGDDWMGKEVAGQDIVEQSGGRVIFLHLRPGISTSEIIRRCRE